MEYYIQNVTSISPQPTFETDDFLSQPVSVESDTESLPAIEPNYKDYITDAGLRRRMSRIVKMGVAAAMNCVKNAAIENPDAIITATGLGCLTDTGKFLNTMVVNNEQLLNPTSFIQSTFNTIGAQIALILKNHNYNFTYVHRGFSFESAVLDAIMQLEDGEANSVLVGSVDEITPTSFQLMKRMGFWRHGAKMGEGAQFFILSAIPSPNDYALLKAVSTFLLPKKNGQAETTITDFLTKNKIDKQDIDLILFGKSGDFSQDLPFTLLEQGLFNHIPSATFKHLCGEYQTASSFGLWCAANILKRQAIPAALNPTGKPEKIERILVYNVYRNTNHSLFLLNKKS